MLKDLLDEIKSILIKAIFKLCAIKNNELLWFMKLFIPDIIDDIH